MARHPTKAEEIQFLSIPLKTLIMRAVGERYGFRIEAAWLERADQTFRRAGAALIKALLLDGPKGRFREAAGRVGKQLGSFFIAF